MRRAIAHAIDMRALCATVLEGTALPADSLVPDGPWKAPDLERREYDPGKARALLGEARWEASRELDLVYDRADRGTVGLVNAIQASLAAVGIRVRTRLLIGNVPAELGALPVDPVKGPSRVVWDLACVEQSALALQEYFNPYRTGRSAHAPGSAELDALIDAVNGTADPEKQRQAFYAIERYMAASLPAIPLCHERLFVYESTRLDRNGGPYSNDLYNYDWRITGWTVTPDASGRHVMRSSGAPIGFFQNPWSNPGTWITSKVLFDRLLAADGALTPSVGQLAASYRLTADGLTLAFTLRSGLLWHDGSPLTVDDVKWSVEYATRVPTVHALFKATFSSLEGAAEFQEGKASSISGIRTAGDTITFRFARVDPNCLLTFSQWAPLPRKQLADVDPLGFQQAAYWQNPVGSGPYRVERVKMNAELAMVPFSDYWGGVARIDEILCYPSFENDLDAVKNAAAGRLDYGFTRNAADVKALRAMGHMSVRPVNIPHTRMLLLNQFPRPAR